MRGERVDVGERHGRDSGSGADGGLRESRAARQPPSDAPSGSGRSAPARSQRLISQPFDAAEPRVDRDVLEAALQLGHGRPAVLLGAHLIGGRRLEDVRHLRERLAGLGRRGQRAAVGDAGEGVDRRLAGVLALRPDADLDLGARQRRCRRRSARRRRPSSPAGVARGRRLASRRGRVVAGAVVAGAVVTAPGVTGSASSSLPQPAATRARALIRTRTRCRRSVSTSL